MQDICLMPLLDGSRGIDFTSPHSTGQDPDQLARAMWGEGGARLASAPPQGAARADGCELQLVAYTVRLVRARARVRLSPNPNPSPNPSPNPNQVRLLERKALLASRLKSICAEAEAELLKR